MYRVRSLTRPFSQQCRRCLSSVDPKEVNLIFARKLIENSIKERYPDANIKFPPPSGEIFLRSQITCQSNQVKAYLDGIFSSYVPIYIPIPPDVQTESSIDLLNLRRIRIFSWIKGVSCGVSVVKHGTLLEIVSNPDHHDLLRNQAEAVLAKLSTGNTTEVEVKSTGNPLENKIISNLWGRLVHYKQVSDHVLSIFGHTGDVRWLEESLGRVERLTSMVHRTRFNELGVYRFSEVDYQTVCKLSEEGENEFGVVMVPISPIDVYIGADDERKIKPFKDWLLSQMEMTYSDVILDLNHWQSFLSYAEDNDQVQINAFKSTKRAYVATSNGQTASDILSNLTPGRLIIPVTPIEKNFVKNWLRANPQSPLARCRHMSWDTSTVTVLNPARKGDMRRLLNEMEYRTVEIENGVLFNPLIKYLGDLNGVAIAKTTPTTVTLTHNDVKRLDGMMERVGNVLARLSLKTFSVSSVLSQLFQGHLLKLINVEKSGGYLAVKKVDKTRVNSNTIRMPFENQESEDDQQWCHSWVVYGDRPLVDSYMGIVNERINQKISQTKNFRYLPFPFMTSETWVSIQGAIEGTAVKKGTLITAYSTLTGQYGVNDLPKGVYIAADDVSNMEEFSNEIREILERGSEERETMLTDETHVITVPCDETGWWQIRKKIAAQFPQVKIRFENRENVRIQGATLEAVEAVSLRVKQLLEKGRTVNEGATFYLNKNEEMKLKKKWKQVLRESLKNRTNVSLIQEKLTVNGSGDINQTLKYISRAVGGVLTRDSHQFTLEDTDSETINFVAWKLQGQINEIQTYQTGSSISVTCRWEEDEMKIRNCLNSTKVCRQELQLDSSALGELRGFLFNRENRKNLLKRLLNKHEMDKVQLQSGYESYYDGSLVFLSEDSKVLDQAVEKIKQFIQSIQSVQKLNLPTRMMGKEFDQFLKREHGQWDVNDPALNFGVIPVFSDQIVRYFVDYCVYLYGGEDIVRETAAKVTTDFRLNTTFGFVIKTKQKIPIMQVKDIIRESSRRAWIYGNEAGDLVYRAQYSLTENSFTEEERILQAAQKLIQLIKSVGEEIVEIRRETFGLTDCEMSSSESVSSESREDIEN